MLADWRSALLLDDCDRHLLEAYRLEYKKGNGGYWKVLAVPRGVSGRNRKYTMFARLIMQPSRDQQVDHIDGNTLDNRRANLRICTQSQNSRNRVAKMPHGFRGVGKARNGFTAQIKHELKCYFLGVYPTAVEAAHAYDKAAVELHGEFARLNFPEHYAHGVGTRAALAQAHPSATLAGAACFFAFHAVSNTSVSEQYLVTR